jgi:serine O-acetyltransferase
MTIPPPLGLRAGTGQRLLRFTAAQLNNLMPEDGLEADVAALEPLVPRALERMRPILAAVRNFDPDRFNHLNSLQYATYLYLLANEQWHQDPKTTLTDRLFCLNRALNCIDLFYVVPMPAVFFLSHGLGAVLGNASYGNRLVVFQGVTVGRVGDDRPVIGDNVVLFPGATVTGRSTIGDNVVIATGTRVHGLDVPPDTVVSSQGDKLVLKPRTRDYMAIYFRSPG